MERRQLSVGPLTLDGLAQVVAIVGVGALTFKAASQQLQADRRRETVRLSVETLREFVQTVPASPEFALSPMNGISFLRKLEITDGFRGFRATRDALDRKVYVSPVQVQLIEHATAAATIVLNYFNTTEMMLESGLIDPDIVVAKLWYLAQIALPLVEIAKTPEANIDAMVDFVRRYPQSAVGRI